MTERPEASAGEPAGGHETSTASGGSHAGERQGVWFLARSGLGYVARRAYWANLFSLRLWWTVLVGGLFLVAIPAYLLTRFVWGGFDFLFYAVYGVWPVLFVLMLITAGPPACPRCGKRIKQGYDTCHHCGYTAAR